MWLKQKQKNRRLHRGHVLDVKLRSDQVRASRARMATIACGGLFGTMFGLYLLWCAGAWALDRLVYENSTFAIQTIDVQTDGVIAPEQLRQWSGIKPGANLVALNLAAVKRNLELVSTVESVSIERVLPRTLKIRITERVPVAQVNLPGADTTGALALSVFQLAADGIVMRPLDPAARTLPLGQTTADLPVITGLNVYQLQAGRSVESPQVQSALQLIRAFGHSPMAGLVDLRRIDVSSPQVVVVTTTQGSQLTFALDNIEQQLRHWRQIYDLGQQMKKTIATADLAVANNVPVRWMDMTPATPRNTAPTGARRRNV